MPAWANIVCKLVHYMKLGSASSMTMSHASRLRGRAVHRFTQGFRSPYRPRREGALRFGELLERVAAVDREMRVRFTSPHPKDFSDDVLAVRSWSRVAECTLGRGVPHHAPPQGLL